MNRTKELVETSLLVALAAVLFLASNVLPVLGVVVTLVCPVPLVVLGLRAGLGRALLGTGVAGVIVTAFLGPLGGLFFTLGFGVLGVGLGCLARRFGSSTEILLWGILISLGSKLALMAIVTFATGINPFSIDPDQIRGGMEMAGKLFGGGADLGMEFRKEMERTLQALPMLFPALLVMASALDCFLGYVVGRAVTARIGGAALPPLLPFEQWRFPKSLFWAFVASILFTLWKDQTPLSAVLFRAGVNLRIVVSMLFLLQGAAVAQAWLSVRGAGKWRWSVLALMLLIPLFSQIGMLVGVADIWLDLRVRMGIPPRNAP